MAIKIDSVSLLRCDFNFIESNNERKCDLAICDFESKILKNVNEPSKLLSMVSFDFMNGVEKPIFTLKCIYAIVYSFENDKDLEKLKPHVIIAHIIPYLREFASSLTSRMPGPHLYLDPINTVELFKRYEDMKSKSTESVVKTAQKQIVKKTKKIK